MKFLGLTTFLNPLAVDVKDYGGQAIGKPEFTLNLSKYTSESLINSSTTNKTIFKTLPLDLQQRLKNGDRTIPLDMDKVGFFHYKKERLVVVGQSHDICDP